MFSRSQHLISLVLAVVVVWSWLIFHKKDHPFISPEQKKLIFIEVAGNIAHPGVYHFETEPFWDDVLAAAGGMISQAPIKKPYFMNSIPTGTRIFFSQAVDGTAQVQIKDMDSKTRIVLGIPLDVNTATKKDLELLPFIGPKHAERIVQWREKNGNFENIWNLRQVKGIGRQTIEKLLPFLAVKP